MDTIHVDESQAPSGTTRARFVGFRVTPEEWARLEEMAARCERTPSDVIRLLLEMVDVSQLGTGIPRTAIPSYRVRRLASKR